VRLFLAVDLPPAVRAALGALQSRLRARCGGWRWVRPEGMHLTLRFLGEVPPDLDAASRNAWREAVRPFPPFRFGLEGLGRFPAGGRPRVLWVGVREARDEAVLPGLAESLERAARDCGFAPEGRAFSPHLTLARAARDARAEWPRDSVAGIGETVDVQSVVLFRSELHPAGARYTALEAFTLEGGRERP